MKRYACSPRIDERSSRVTKSRSSRSSSVSLERLELRRELLERALPEDPADHRRALEQRFSLRRQPVDARGDQRLQRVGDAARCRRSRSSSSIRTSPRRRAGCPRSSRAASARSAGASSWSASERVEQLLALARARAARARSRSRARGRRPSRDGCRAARAARGRGSAAAPRAPGRRGARSARAAAPRPSGCPRRRGRAAAPRASSLRPTRAPPRRSPAGCARPRTASSTPTASPSRSATASSSQQARSFSIASSTRVVVGDPGRALDHLGERPVGDALAVGQAAAGEHGRALDAVERTRARAGSCRRRARRRS